jgi:toxin ParE1/3/4
MTGSIISPRAQADLDEIWDYTVERWSENQAESYIRDIWQAIEVMAGDPRRARACDDIRSGYRKYPVGAHVLFFRTLDDGIDIVRILHQRMDFERHL